MLEKHVTIGILGINVSGSKTAGFIRISRASRSPFYDSNKVIVLYENCHFS